MFRPLSFSNLLGANFNLSGQTKMHCCLSGHEIHLSCALMSHLCARLHLNFVVNYLVLYRLLSHGAIMEHLGTR